MGSLPGSELMTPDGPVGGRAPEPRAGVLRSSRITRVVAGAAALGILAVLAIAVSTSGFLTVANGQAIALSVAVTIILAIGLTFITLGGNLFSLSLGATVLGSAALFLASLKFGIVPAILLSLLGGAIVGAMQGAFVGGIEANPIVTTLAASSLIIGLILGLTNGEAVLPPEGATSFHRLTETNVLEIPVSALFALALAVIGQTILTWTRFGRELKLTGANRAAARAAGIPIARIAVIAFCISGACAGLAGVLVGATSGQATVGFVNTYDFDAITAVVLGGTLVSGGRGSVWQTVLAAILLAILGNVLLLRGMGFNDQLFVKGLILVIAIGLAGALRIGREGK